MTQKLTRWQGLILWLAVLPTLFPLISMLPSLITRNADVINTGIADVLGTGAEIALLLCLLVTPLITVTGQRWIEPLRKWYGRIFAVTAITDAVFAAIYTDFAGPALDKIAGHPFLLVGALMVLLGLALLFTSSLRAQKWLGRYWKKLHALIYVIWALLLIHLALLFGFGNQPDDSFVHQRFFQLVACSVVLVVFRIPAIKRWCIRSRRAGNMAPVYWLFVPLMILFAAGMGFIINEEIFKGSTVILLHPIED